MENKWFKFKYELLLCILLLLLFQLDNGIQFIMFRVIGIKYDSLIAHIISIILHAGIFTVVIAIGLHDQKTSLVDVCHFKKPGLNVLGAAALCSIGFVLLMFYLNHITYLIFTGWPAYPAGNYINRFLPVVIINTCVIPAIAEELLFKGVIFKGLEKRYSRKTAVIISSIMFSICHLNPVRLITHFLFSACTFWLYLRTGSILFPILIHFINNLLANVLIAEPFALLETFLAAQVIFWLGFYLLWRVTKKQDIPEEGPRINAD